MQLYQNFIQPHQKQKASPMVSWDIYCFSIFVENKCYFFVSYAESYSFLKLIKTQWLKWLCEAADYSSAAALHGPVSLQTS